jgi:flagellar hook protein FlgE
MSLFGSLFSGVSGLNAQSRAMGMISDNIANVNTTAYKGATAQFANMVTRSRGSTTYSPGGVRAQSYYTVASQGLIQSSASPTDAAISGAGFFVVNTQPGGGGEQLYARIIHEESHADQRLAPCPTGSEMAYQARSAKNIVANVLHGKALAWQANLGQVWP